MSIDWKRTILFLLAFLGGLHGRKFAGDVAAWTGMSRAFVAFAFLVLVMAGFDHLLKFWWVRKP